MSLATNAAALALAAALSAGAGWWLRDTQAQAQVNALQASHAQQLAQCERQAREASEAQRAAETQARNAIAQETAHARTQAAAHASDAAGLRAVAGRLRQHIAALAAAGAHPADATAAAADRGDAATGPGLVYADLHAGAEEAVDLAVDLAIAFDAARAAGLACQRIYAVAEAGR